MSGATLSPALIRALQAGRGQFNARVAEACRAQPGFDTGAVQALLQGPLNQLATQAAAFEPERVNSLLLAAFDVGLTLQLQGKAGQPVIQSIWRDALPACLPLALAQPRDTLGKLFNAALNLLAIGGARPEQWTREMTRLAGRCADPAALSGLGQVLAWRCGAAHFRTGALRVARDLPADLAAGALALAQGQEITAALTRLESDPWFDPARPDEHGLRAMHEVGGFTGFGGPFATPPQVRAYADGFIVRSAERHWHLCADAFGAVLHACPAEEFAAGAEDSGALILNGSELRLGAQACLLDLPPEGLRVVAGDQGSGIRDQESGVGPRTAAVTSPYSHFIRLLALS
ncbi:hypothetical protein FACS1894158_05050 [Betaproteobacteria bacterium]|nr:hypothetical protein FACS1894158_05050 [Betaproteobacteria bacterium]